MPTKTTDFHVLMLGKRGTGKTTMLAVLWDQLDNLMNTRLGYFESEFSTSKFFGEALEKLRTMFLTPGTSVGLGIEGTDESKELEIALKTHGHENPHLRLRFWDYSGGLLNTTGVERSDEALFQRKLDLAQMIFIIVDAPALMEHNGLFNSSRNSPETIRKIIRNKTLKGATNVLFVVTRAEKYIRDNQREEIYKRVEDSYKKLINDLAINNSVGNICIVETLGSIVLDELLIKKTEEGEMYPQYSFKKISENATHSPRDTTIPLKLLLDTAIETSYSTRRKESEGFNWLRDILERDKELLDILNHLRTITTKDSSVGSFRALAPANNTQYQSTTNINSNSNSSFY